MAVQLWRGPAHGWNRRSAILGRPPDEVGQECPTYAGPCKAIHILAGLPLRFDGVAGNRPETLQRCMSDALSAFNGAERGRFVFHSFVYSEEDHRRWRATGFGERAPAAWRVEKRKSYPKFLRFMAWCDAVINISAASVLGRNTFLSARWKSRASSLEMWL